MRTRDRARAPERSGDAPAIDPLADLLFTMIAAVLPAILVLAPLLKAPSLAEAKQVRPGPAASPAAVLVDGRRARTIVATTSGLELAGGDPRSIGLDAIPDDPGLAADLDRIRDTGVPPLLIVEPDGLESAFLLEPLLAAHGISDLKEVRATEPCRSARDDALRQACAAVPARSR